MVGRLLGLIDKANGYVYASLSSQSPYPPEFVFGNAAEVCWGAQCWGWGPGHTPAFASCFALRAQCNTSIHPS
jgi:hypothetical protein